MTLQTVPVPNPSLPFFLVYSNRTKHHRAIEYHHFKTKENFPHQDLWRGESVRWATGERTDY